MGVTKELPVDGASRRKGGTINAAKNLLVVDGRKLKLRYEERRMETQSACVIDWLRFTFDRDKVKLAGWLHDVGDIPPEGSSSERYRHECEVRHVAALTPRERADYLRDVRRRRGEHAFAKMLEAVLTHEALMIGSLRHLTAAAEDLRSDAETEAIQQAKTTAREVAKALGDAFSVGELKRGHDFYKHRVEILFNGFEVGAVLCWVATDSPAQARQKETINVNLHGSACTFGAPGWERRLHAMCATLKAKLTRADLAVDFFNGREGGIEAVFDEYQDGTWDHLGKRPKIGDVNWLQGHSRSLYMGSKEAGKQLNVYEKADQLFSHEEAVRLGHKWIRFEQRFGNKLRVIDLDILLRPADFFAGCSDAHCSVLLEGQQDLDTVHQLQPQSLPCERPSAVLSVDAEVVRVVKWCRDTARYSMGLLFKFMQEGQLGDLLDTAEVPRRLKKFGSGQIRQAFDSLSHPLYAQAA